MTEHEKQVSEEEFAEIARKYLERVPVPPWPDHPPLKTHIEEQELDTDEGSNTSDEA